MSLRLAAECIVGDVPAIQSHDDKPSTALVVNVSRGQNAAKLTFRFSQGCKPPPRPAAFA